ncbi:hypothetical protein ABT024_39405, partial [Streptomyces sp. NPDC002812]|uniref:hypothetical protein n=1 Tax=Streptomyces sp. NPDC002812 TaxID=3154434 RepID=UPI003325952B
RAAARTTRARRVRASRASATLCRVMPVSLTTVMHADRKIRALMAERRSIYNQVTELTNRIKNG